MNEIIIINFTDQILSLHNEHKIDQYTSFENLKITGQQTCFIIVKSLSDIPDTKYAAKIIDKSNISFYLITIDMEPDLIEKNLITKSVKALISGFNQKNLMYKLNELINMV